jgi:predicted GNAT superfamily acetyltransferase
MRDELNAGLLSDRFQVEWHFTSDHVADRLHSDWVGDSSSALRAEGVPILNPALPGDDGLLCPSQKALPIEGDRLLIQIPAHFQAIKATDLELARAWREHIRVLFEAAFAAGYTVVDLLFEKTKGKGGQSFYLLREDWMPG